MKARLIVAGIVVLLAMALVPTAQAAPRGCSTAVSGDWSWMTINYTVTPLPDGNQLFAGDENGTWTGTFKGTSYDVFAMTLTPPFGETDPNVYGAAWGSGTVIFTGRVNGRHGSLVLDIWITEPANDPVMTGTWRIIFGTKALKHVSGHGTWVSSGVDSSAKYAGKLCWK